MKKLILLAVSAFVFSAMAQEGAPTPPPPADHAAPTPPPADHAKGKKEGKTEKKKKHH